VKKSEQVKAAIHGKNFLLRLKFTLKIVVI